MLDCKTLTTYDVCNYYLRGLCPERLVLRGGAFRSEKDANGAADRHNRAGCTLRHQRDHSDHHFAIGEGGG